MAMPILRLSIILWNWNKMCWWEKKRSFFPDLKYKISTKWIKGTIAFHCFSVLTYCNYLLTFYNILNINQELYRLWRWILILVPQLECITIPDLHQLKVPSFGWGSDVSPQPYVLPRELLCTFINLSKMWLMTFPHAHQCMFSFSLSNLLNVKETKIQEKGCLPFLSSLPRGTDRRM